MLVPGYGNPGRKEHVRLFRDDLEEPRADVLEHAREGKSLDEMKQLAIMSKDQGWAGYKEMGTLNVEGMYRLVQGQRRPN